MIEPLETVDASVSELRAPTPAVEFTPLVTDFHLYLHTKAARSVFEGEWEKGKMGLAQFSNHVNVLLQAMEKDDPYAQWQLIKIYDKIQTLKTVMQQHGTMLYKQIGTLRGIRIKPFRNAQPFNTLFTSVTPLILMAANLITAIDLIACQILTLRQMGIVPQGQGHTLDYREKIQDIFALAGNWEQADMTREDIRENNKKAQRMEKKYGKLPEEVLQKTVEMPFLFLTE